MKYIQAFNIWNIPNELIKHIQIGQWIYAGNKDNQGIYLGVKSTGIIVVAWKGNIDNQHNKKQYIKTLRDYAKS